MTNENSEPSFPQTRQDLSNLKKTALDAAKDISSTAAVHAQKAQTHLKDLASHAKEEGSEEFGQVKVRFSDLGTTVRDYVSARPLVSIGTALAVGFLLGLSRRSCSRAD